MDINDVTSENFFKLITFQSDPSPQSKLKLPDGEFILCAIMLRLIGELQKVRLGK